MQHINENIEIGNTGTTLNEIVQNFKYVGPSGGESANVYKKIISTKFTNYATVNAAFLLFGTVNLKGFALLVIDAYGQGTVAGGKLGIYMLSGGDINTNRISAYRESDGTLNIYYLNTAAYQSIQVVKLGNPQGWISFPFTAQTTAPSGNKITITSL